MQRDRILVTGPFALYLPGPGAFRSFCVRKKGGERGSGSNEALGEGARTRMGRDPVAGISILGSFQERHPPRVARTNAAKGPPSSASATATMPQLPGFTRPPGSVQRADTRIRPSWRTCPSEDSLHDQHLCSSVEEYRKNFSAPSTSSVRVV